MSAKVQPTVPTALSTPNTWTANILDSSICDLNAKKFLRIAIDSPIDPKCKNENYTNGNIICLRGSLYGGLWRVTKIEGDNMVLYCPVDLEVNNNEDFKFKWEVSAAPSPDENMILVAREDKDSSGGHVIVSEGSSSSGGAPVGANQYLGTVSFATALILQTRITVMAVSNVDTVAQTFTADVYAELRIRRLSRVDNIDYVQQMLKILNINKHIEFLGTVSTNSREEWSDLKRSQFDSSTCDFNYKFKISASIAERMELETFPFDQQQLNLVLSISKHVSAVRMVENKEYPSVFKQKNFHLSSVFDVVSGDIVFAEAQLSDPKESSTGTNTYPQMRFSILLERRSSYYVSNVMLPSFLISGVSFICFGVNEDGSKMDTSSRLSITLTLLLTAVAYKFVVASSLPQLSYSTFLDIYVWGCFGFILIMAVENTIFPACIARVGLEHSGKEWIVLVALLCLFCVWNLIWLIGVVVWKKKRRSSDLNMIESEKQRRQRNQKQRPL